MSLGYLFRSNINYVSSYSVENTVRSHQSYRARYNVAQFYCGKFLSNLQNNSLPTPSPTIRDQTDRNQTVCMPLAQTWLRQTDRHFPECPWADRTGGMADRGTDLPEIWHDLSGIRLGAVTGGNSWPAVSGVGADWRGFISNQLI